MIAIGDMGFWPFGQKPAADVEVMSRVVTADARDHRRVRGKLTVHFVEPQTQQAADQAADVCASIAGTILREAESHAQLIGGEAAIVAEIARRLPADLTPTRSIELVSLHVVGDPGSSPAVRRPSSRGMAAVTPPLGLAAPVPTPAPVPATVIRTPAMPEPVTPSLAARSPASRSSSSRLRVANLVIPPGTAVPGIGAALAPLVHDAATRLLVGLLRTYDLIVIRGVDLDDGGSDHLSALVPTPDAPLGGFETSRAQELTRWQTTLGGPAFASLRREAIVFTVYLGYSAMLESNVPQALAVPVIEALCATGFQSEAPPQAELGRYLHLVEPTLVEELAKHALGAVGAPSSAQASMARALSPLLAAIQDDMSFAATLVRHASS